VRSFLGTVLVGALVAVPAPAASSVAQAASLEDLARTSVVIAWVTPTSQRSEWEGGRIITTTCVHVDAVVAGGLTGAAEACVRSLGGVVGRVGQVVEGEPIFRLQRHDLVFLTRGRTGAFTVTARAQGQLTLAASADGAERLRHAAPLGALVGAAATLEGLSIEEAQERIATVWAAREERQRTTAVSSP
jgi:hypothetical protein